jgi:hypothetical protein
MKIINYVVVFFLLASCVSAVQFNLPVSWVMASNGTSVDANNNGYVDWCDNSVSGGSGGGGTVTSVSGDGYYVLGTITAAGTFSFNESRLNDTITARAPAGASDGNNYTNSAVFTNGSTVTLTLGRVGMSNIVAQFNNSNVFYSENSPYLSLSGYVFDFSEATLNTTITSRTSKLNMIVLSNTTYWDKNTANNVNTTTQHAGDVSGTYNALVVADDSHKHDCANITGATSDLCTIVDTDKDTLWDIDGTYLTNASSVLTFDESLLNDTIDARVGGLGGGTVTSVSGDGVYVDGTITTSGTFTFNESKLNSTITARASINDQNNYTTSVGITGTTTKTIRIARTGMANITGAFTDIDTDTSNYTNSAVFTNGSTVTLTLGRVGMSNIVAQFNNSNVFYSENSPYLSLSGYVFGFSEATLNTTIDLREINQYTKAIGFSGTSTKTLNLARDGLANLTATFADIDTSNYTSNVVFTNGSTVTMTLYQVGRPNLVRTFNNSGAYYTENSPYLSFSGNVLSFSETVLNTTITSRTSKLNMIVLSNTTYWDKNTANNVNTTTSFSGEIKGTYNTINVTDFPRFTITNTTSYMCIGKYKITANTTDLILGGLC